MTRIFVVDDSAFIRKALARVLGAEPGFQLVGQAAGGMEALEKIPEARPDLVTLDVAMPGMDGQQVLRALLQWKPTLKVVMLSAHTQEGAAATLEALAGGAVDFIDKTSFNLMDLETLRRQVIEKLHVWRSDRTAAANGKRAPATAGGGNADLLEAAAECELCVIGASTGGPVAIQRIMEQVPAGFPMPMVVVQHMPAGFTGPFAQRLSRLAELDVREAEEGDRLRSGLVLVAPAGRHLRITPKLTVTLLAPADDKHVPSVDITMKSAHKARPGKVLAILLTGMGQDGAEGMSAIRAGGGVTLAESESSCVVYGMPRAAETRGAVSAMMALPEIVAFLEAVGRSEG